MRHFAVIAIILLMAVSASAEVFDAEGLVSTVADIYSMFPNYLVIAQDAESKEERHSKPPLNAGRITGEFLAGVSGSVVGMVLGAEIGSLVNKSVGNPKFHFPMGDTDMALWVFILL